MDQVNKIKQAVILAGGQGTRLRPLTDDRPKPMVPVHGRPFLEYLIELLREQGIEEVVLLLGYRPEKITEYFGDGSQFGVTIHYSITPVEDETGTRIRKAEHLIADRFLLMYCDNYWPLQLSRLVDQYERAGTLGLITSYRNRDGGGEYGRANNLSIAESGHVRSYSPASEQPEQNGLDIGFFVFNRRILEYIPEGNPHLGNDVLPRLIERRELTAYETDHPYYPLTKPEHLPALESALMPKQVVFLDRDGVINKQAAEHRYIKSWDEFEFLPGAIEALQLLQQHGYQIFIITNQRGIARGMMTEVDLQDVHDRMLTELQRRGVTIKAIYHCPHDHHHNCECCKPKPGMLFRAAREHYLDLTKAILIGDSKSDIETGEAARCQAILAEPNRNLLDIVKALLNE